jgi:UDP-N-acetylglucosamine 2-epimerase (non-hydrolysing)
MRLGKVMAVFGTRPEAIKMAPVVQALREVADIDTEILVTAQHREMLDQVLELFQLKPDYDLNIMREKQDLYGITARVLQGAGEIFRREQPDMVLVHGDTTTTFAAALAAFYEHIPVGHVEAGLRTHRRYSPFPEEMNRVLTGNLAELHFAPTEQARRNLLAAGAAEFSIWVTGNTVIDALHATLQKPFTLPEELAGIDFSGRIILLTTHRRENWGENMRSIYQAILDLQADFSDVNFIFPVHRNPVVYDLAAEMLGGKPRINLLPPLDYQTFSQVMNRAYLVLTDSGGLQEEAPALGKPVLVLRENTERPEAVEAGTVQLVGTAREQIFNAARRLLADERAYQAMAAAVNPYGDGQAAGRIRDVIRDFLYVKKGSLAD